jgi:hypothetical protein
MLGAVMILSVLAALFIVGVFSVGVKTTIASFVVAFGLAGVIITGVFMFFYEDNV